MRVLVVVTGTSGRFITFTDEASSTDFNILKSKLKSLLNITNDFYIEYLFESSGNSLWIELQSSTDCSAMWEVSKSNTPRVKVSFPTPSLLDATLENPANVTGHISSSSASSSVIPSLAASYVYLLLAYVFVVQYLQVFHNG